MLDKSKINCPHHQYLKIEKKLNKKFNSQINSKIKNYFSKKSKKKKPFNFHIIRGKNMFFLSYLILD